jgi:hypothetical protein
MMVEREIINNRSKGGFLIGVNCDKSFSQQDEQEKNYQVISS